jgi:hypothetical protein
MCFTPKGKRPIVPHPSPILKSEAYRKLKQKEKNGLVHIKDKGQNKKVQMVSTWVRET